MVKKGEAWKTLSCADGSRISKGIASGAIRKMTTEHLVVYKLQGVLWFFALIPLSDA